MELMRVTALLFRPAEKYGECVGAGRQMFRQSYDILLGYVTCCLILHNAAYKRYVESEEGTERQTVTFCILEQ